MSNIHHLHHAAQGGAEFVKNLAPLPEPKSPVVAFMAGFRTSSIAWRVPWTVSHGLDTVNDFSP